MKNSIFSISTWDDGCVIPLIWLNFVLRINFFVLICYNIKWVMRMKLYVARHGQTTANTEEIICGITDASLNPQGIDQAKQLGEELRKIQFDLIFSSPLKRAYLTGDIVCAKQACPNIKDERLTEINFGKFEGMPKSTPEFYEFKRNHGVRYPGGETYFEVVTRVYNFINELKEKYPDKTILLVCHSGIIRTINTYFHDCDNDEIFNYVAGNCELIEYPEL